MLRDTNNKKKHFVIVGKGGGGGIEQVQSDWAQTDNTQVDYIKNKPTIKSEWFGTQAEFDLIDPKDANTIYYIEDANGSVVHNNKTYGIKVKIDNPELTDVQITSNGTYQHTGYYGYDEVEVNVQPNLTTLNATTNDTYTPTSPVQGYSEVTVNVQPNLTTLNATVNGTYTPTSPAQGYSEVTVNVGGYVAPQYMTGKYWLQCKDRDLPILYTISNIAGWRFKGSVNWETPVREIPYSMLTSLNCGIIEIEFNSTDNTKIAQQQFREVKGLVGIELPTTITTIENEAFFNGNLIELPNLDNVTTIGASVFYNMSGNKINGFVIDDNVDRTGYNPFMFNMCDTNSYILINGMVMGFNNDQNADIDLSNGLNGHTVTAYYAYLSQWTIGYAKFPSTLEYVRDYCFKGCTFIDGIYFYGATPPTLRAEIGQTFCVNCSIPNVYVPQGSLAAYQAAFPELASVMQEMS